MGTDCHVRIVGDGDVGWAESEVRRLEALWTRFDAGSELSRVGPQPTRVSPETRLLIERAWQGYRLTEGAFNPFLLDQLKAAGYDRDFDAIEEPVQRPAAPAGEVDLVIDGDVVSCSAPIDSGGIGKGLGADLVAEALVRQGAQGALVNLGGDLRCCGEGPVGRWRITLPETDAGGQVQTVQLQEGAVCTSTPRKRRWTVKGGGQAHHLIDPRTGRPAGETYASVSVIAPEGWVAEVLSKAVYMLPPAMARGLLARENAGAVVVEDDGGVWQM